MEEETRTVLPAVALRGRTVLPSTVIHFDINRVRSVRAVENAMLKDQKVFLVTQRDSTVEEPTQDDLYQIGTVALILVLLLSLSYVLAEALSRIPIIGKFIV